jgi:fibronectin type 3 domain-containing protein
VVPALPVPEDLVITDAPDAAHLEWHAAAPQFRIFRRLSNEVNWSLIGTSDKPSYTDNTIEYGKTYQYFAQSIQKIDNQYAESEIPPFTTFTPVDKFPPAVPAGLSAVPGTRSIELVWDRNTEKDLASYRVYRDGQKVAEGVTAPAFSDKDAKPGVKYGYQVSAVDNAGNESAKSAVAEGTIP